MSHSSTRNPDLLHGSISDKILRIAIPLACTSILQQLFNSADMAVVGRFAGSEALAAVGANSSLINMLVNMFVGLSVGANAVIARHLGSGDTRRAGETAHTAIVLAVISGLFLAVIGQVFPRIILQWISTPEDILPLASLYLRIYFAGMPFIMLYNFTSAIFRSKGDTGTPLTALTIGGVLNVLLNLFFVIVMELSVAGVALATVIANIVSSMILMIKLMHATDALHIERSGLRLNLRHTADIAAIGLPAGFQATLFSFSNVMIQSAINALGTQTIAANAAEVTYEFMTFYLLSSFTQTNVTFVGQNYGARNLPRCRQGIRRSLLLAEISIILSAILLTIFARPLLSIFTTDSEVIELGVIRFHIVICTQWLNTLIDNLSGALRGLGHSLAPALVCIAGICGFRLIYILGVYPISPSYRHLLLVYPISWVITLTIMLIIYFRTMGKLSKGISD